MNQEQQYDIVVAYRIYPKMSGTCGLFKNDEKYEMSHLCLKSFVEATAYLHVKMIAILDSCPDEYELLFRKYYNDEDLKIIHTTCSEDYIDDDKAKYICARVSLLKQIEELIKQNESEYVYIAEDDYFYLPKAIKYAYTLIRNNKDVDIVTTYDHPDFYNRDFYISYPNHLIHENRTWRRVRSTGCMNYLTRKSMLMEKKYMFDHFIINGSSIDILSRLSKINSFNILYYFKYLIKFIRIKSLKILGRDYTNIDKWPGGKRIINIWLKGGGWKHLLFGKKIIILAPYMSLSTHMAIEYLAYNKDWYNEFNRLGSTIGLKKKF